MGARNENRWIYKYDVGEAINEVIALSGIRKKDIARQLSISPSTLTGYITNNRVPDIFTLLRLCEICKVEPNHLFGYKPSNYVMDQQEAILIEQLRKFDAKDKNEICKHMMSAIRLAVEMKESTENGSNESNSRNI